MHRALLVLAASSLIAVLPACGGSGGGDGEPPRPVNQLSGMFTGGSAGVAAVTAYDSNGDEAFARVVNWDLLENCSPESSPQGTLCDEAPTTGSLTASTKSTVGSGATWDASDGLGGLTTGVLVIDTCADGLCAAIHFSEARVFQAMDGYGKTTHIRLSYYSYPAGLPPAWDDSSWAFIGDGTFSPVHDGTTTDAGVTVIDPTVFELGPQWARWLRVEVQNDGDLLDSGYIELRALKLF